MADSQLEVIQEILDLANGNKEVRIFFDVRSECGVQELLGSENVYTDYDGDIWVE